MAALSFESAYQCVLEEVSVPETLALESVRLLEATGRVLAEDIPADRDYPPLPRSARDGFAVRSADLPGRLRVIGEVRAGESFEGALGAGEAVEIMTGAPMPSGADAVLMVEHAAREGDYIETTMTLAPNSNFSPAASDTQAGELVLRRGQRLDYARIAMAATVGRNELRVFRRPRVAILATGDEVVPVNTQPLPFQVRNSNVFSLASQVDSAGGDPVILPVAPDDKSALRELIAHGIESDLLLLSGGVSAGKYDLVEPVLQEFGARFFFDRVKIQPGQPTVFGVVQGKFFFGLPGNPASTMVTFLLFASLAVRRLAGEADVDLPILEGRLTRDFQHKPVLTRFLPAMLRGNNVTPIDWKGSSDVPALARANAFFVASADRERYSAGEHVGVIPR